MKAKKNNLDPSLSFAQKYNCRISFRDKMRFGVA
jgi:hypothetical protein